MKELLEKILPYIPLYITNLVAVLTGPKSFVRDKHEGDEGVKQSLIFFGMSIAVTFILNLPARVHGENFWEVFSNLGFLMLAISVMWALVLQFCWRIVGGKADFKGTFSIHSYFLGAFFPVFSMYMFASDGMQLAHHSPVASQLLDVVAFVCMVSWIVISWGAYRELHALSRARSFIAGVVALGLTKPAFMIAVFIGTWLRSTRGAI